MFSHKGPQLGKVGNYPTISYITTTTATALSIRAGQGHAACGVQHEGGSTLKALWESPAGSLKLVEGLRVLDLNLAAFEEKQQGRTLHKAFEVNDVGSVCRHLVPHPVCLLGFSLYV